MPWPGSAPPKPASSEVLVAPGNAGTAAEPRVRNVAVDAEDIAGLVALARREAVDLTIVGPEGPLVAGVVDAFAAAGLQCFGPDRAWARDWKAPRPSARSSCSATAYPPPATAPSRADHFDPAYVRSRPAPIVVKASGLAAGKGVVIADSHEAAMRAAQRDVRRPVRRRGRRGGHRGLPAGRGSRVSSSWPMAAMCCRWRPRRITSACWMGTWVRTPAAWAPIRPRRSSRRRCTSASCARSSIRPCAAWPPMARPTPGFCMPA